MAFTFQLDNTPVLVSNGVTPSYCTASVNLSTVIATPPLYVALWAKHNGTPAQWDGLIGACGGSSWFGGLSLFVEDASTIRGSFTQYDIDFVSAAVSDLTSWHHYIIGHDGTDARLWVDGVLGGTTAGAAFAGMDHPFTAYRANTYLPGGSSYFWHGTLDEIRVFDRELTTAEIAALSASSVARHVPSVTGDAAYYRVEGSGSDTTVMPDRAGSMDLAISGVATSGHFATGWGTRADRTVTVQHVARSAAIEWD